MVYCRLISLLLYYSILSGTHILLRICGRLRNGSFQHTLSCCRWLCGDRGHCLIALVTYLHFFIFHRSETFVRLCQIETRLLLCSGLSTVNILRVQIPDSRHCLAGACGFSLGHRSVVLVESSCHLPRALG